MKKLLLITALLFTSLVNAQTITIIAPNGGEVLYSCQQYTVTWSQTGSPSNYWNIDYSLDGGTIWSSVSSNYLSTNGTFVWTVPNVQSSTVLMRVKDALNASTVDQSNAFFTINVPIVLTSPNGGETWQGNTVHNITWNAQGTSNTYNIAYSTDNGTTWVNIVTNYSTVSGTYAWTVVNLPSTTCLVRVMDYVQNCMQDISNAVFTISPAQPILLTPNGGESLQSQCNYTITWNPATFYSTVKLEYSIDNGTTWVLIGTYANSGSRNWVVPNMVSNQCLVRASNSANTAINDVSNAVFSIMPITIVSANGGETWYGCSYYNITWTKSTCIQYFNLYYSIDNGATWVMIYNALSTNGLNSQSYSWQVPNGLTSTQAKLKVEDYYNAAALNDVSDAVFTINPSNDITVTSPNGSESWVGNSVHAITWTNLPSASGQYTLQYSTDNGASYTTIASNITGNTYNWTVPNLPSTTCLIKVIDYINNCKYDVSNAVFTITAAQPILLTPNGGESLQSQCNYTITWNAATFYSTVRLDYSIDNGVTWILIGTYANSGSRNWVVPNTVSAQCLIRASNSANLAINDVSNAVFSIMPLTIVSANGGETWYGCSYYNITWTKSTCIQYFNLYYSIDNGATWVMIYNALSTNGLNSQSYSWQVPNGLTSTQAKLKVEDYYNAAALNDVSDAVFTINPSNDITVTSPNGSESWVGNSVHAITWTNLPSASGQYTLQYSTDNGASYTTIASNITGNTYNWTVPNLPSTTCLIKVIDYINNCKYDVSNAVFTITAAQPILITPNGGESLQSQCNYTITWNPATFYSTVKLEYSIDNGTTWVLIGTYANSGSRNWVVPNTVSNQCLVRASNSANTAINDVSNAVFSIMPITIVSANGGETWYGCSYYNITWTKSTCIQYFNLYYSLDNGATWVMIYNALSTNGLNSQSYSWQVPNGLTSTQAKLKVEDYYNAAALNDVSDAVFTINPSNDITVTSPNGSESCVGNSVHAITWTNLPSASGQYTLQYSTDNGASYTTIASNITGNTYNWTVPNLPSTTCLIKVIDYINNCKYDVSNAVFTITAAQPILLTPNGGESLQSQCNYTITWNAATFYSTVRLDYSIDNGVTWVLIGTYANSGSRNWVVPNTVSAQCLIRASNSANLAINDVSNAVFSIMPVTIVSANGGETWYGCSYYNITWTKSTCIQYFNLYYSIDNGVTWVMIYNALSTNGLNSQSYSWQVPNGLTSTQAKLKVEDYYNATALNDVSDAVFTINPSNDITVTSPNGSESWVGNSVHAITWTNLPSASGQYTLQYSTDNGASYTTIASNITGNTYNWTVPNLPSTTCLIKVIDYINNCKYDVSNAVFTITAAQPILITPNGGESLQSQCNYTITWNPATFYSTVKLEYSIDNGTIWVLIGTYANSGSRNWVVPNTVSNQCLVRASNSANTAINDVSNAVFSIMPITIVSANGGETWYGCSYYNITWTKSTCIQYFNLYYSLDNGATWVMIYNALSTNGLNSQSYSWQVPNGLTSTQAKLKVEDYYNAAALNDVSDAVFTINPSNDITVTSPNGSESWVGNSVHAITWTNLPSASGQYTLQYSTDNGASYTTIASNITGNNYNWTVPNLPSTTCLIKVIDYLNNCKYDLSNAVFTITPATPILITPNGGETLYSGTNYAITWNAATFFSTVRLDYSLDNGVTWTLIGTYANNGTRNWVVPNVSSTTCLVKASNSSNLAVNDVSNSVFTIKPAVTIITPNGDNGVTIWGGCTVTSITFDRSPAWTEYSIDYTINNGATWVSIIGYWSTTANPATYNWNMPNIPSNQVRVRVTPYYATTYGDQSDNTFTITKPVTLIQPNFGGIMQVGSVFNITWSSDGISNLYDLYYSTNGGSTFTNIVLGYNTSINTYPWTVPNFPSNNCRIWVKDNINSCKADTSDVAFIISTSPPLITMTSPNGIADTLEGCHTKTITWTDNPTIGTYDIHYSLNSGTTWIPIITSYVTATHSYDWIVPNTINSNTVLLRVRSTAINATYDLSDAYFTIRNGHVVASPHSTSVCYGVPVNITSSGGQNYNWSPSAGLSATNISNPVATPATSTTFTVQSINGSCILSDTVHINITTSGTTASVAISASPSNTICAGNSVTFTATPTYGGTTPAYQWRINGNPVGTNSPTFTSSGFNNNEIVTCVMTSNLPCVAGSPATSNSVTMTVTANVTPAIALVTSPSGSICSGTPVTFTATPTNGDGGPTYQWYLNSNPVGTGINTYSNSALANGDVVYAVLTSNANCTTTATATSSNTTMSVNSIPVIPVSISGNTSVCSGSSNTYTIGAVSGATSYTWILPSGWTGTSTTTSISTVAGLLGGNITVTANNACGSSSSQTLAVTINAAPAQPVSITGNTTVCSGASEIYSITAVSGATSYTWTTPSGWSGSSSSISINPVTGSNSGNVTVSANNSCGSSTVQTLAVTVSSAPAQPTTIVGSTTICSGSTNTYSIGSVSGATSYNWTLPNGWTGSSTGTSISATANASSGTVMVNATNSCGTSTAQILNVTVNSAPLQPTAISGTTTVCSGDVNTYYISAVSGALSYTWLLPSGWSGTSTSTTITATAGGVAGSITVTADNGCGISTAQTLAISMSNVLAQPGIISGNTSVCSGTAQNYSIAPVVGATSYTWSAPSGWSGTSTLDNISLITNATSGTVSVTANNSCGSSAAQTLTVTVNTVPAAPASIIGNTTICDGSTNTYNIGSVAGATLYTWTLPVGWIGTSTTTSITAVADVTSGSVYVSAGNACGNSTAQSLVVTVTSTPAQPATISGSLVVCDNSANTFSVTSVAGATSYTWSLPGGWSGTSTTSSISATSTTTGGAISVTADNACGSSTSSLINVSMNSLPTQPAGLTGGSSVCEGTSQSYSVSPVAGATSYTWTLPATWSGNSLTENITATTGNTGGTISVTADNACGSSVTQTYAVTINPLPVMPVAILGNDTICSGSAQTYSVASVSGATDYTWTLPATWIGTSTTDNITPTLGTLGGTISITANNACGSSAAQTLDVVLNTPPAQPSVITGSTTVCDGSVNIYSVSPDANTNDYTWTLPTTWTGTSTTDNISATADTTDGVITLVANNGCGTSASQSLTVNSNALPVVTLSSFPIVCQSVGAFALTGGSPAGGTYSGTGVSANMFDPSVSGAGIFPVQYTYSDGICSNNASENQQVDVCTGIDNALTSQNVTFAPNPFNEYTVVTIASTVPFKGTELHVYDVVGKEVLVISNIHTYNLKVERKDLRDGMYFFKLMNENREIGNGKLVIE